jgi:uncharacterized repeat protein (TIGR03803 family)
MRNCLRGRIAAAGLVVAALVAAPGAEAKRFSSWPVSFNGTNGNYSVAPLFLGPKNLMYGTTELGGSAQGGGTVFTITSDGNLTPLYDFQQPPDGNGPAGGVALDINKNVYGSTYNGGPESLSYPGTIYEISRKGSERILYNFCQMANCADGMNPNSTIVLDPEGSVLYGTTYAGGGGGAGTLYQITTDGQFGSVYSFCRKPSCTDGSDPIGAPYISSPNVGQDVIYGVTSTGGANGYGVVYRFNAANFHPYQVLFDFDYAHGAYPQGGIILDKKSNIVGVAGGGDTNNGVVYKLTNDGGKPQALYTFSGGPDGAAPVGELVADKKGNFYGVTTAGGTEQGVVYELTPSGVETVLYTFTGGADGGGPKAGLLAVETKTGITLYGTTSAFGAYGYGTVFQLVL